MPMIFVLCFCIMFGDVLHGKLAFPGYKNFYSTVVDLKIVSKEVNLIILVKNLKFFHTSGLRNCIE